MVIEVFRSIDISIDLQREQLSRPAPLGISLPDKALDHPPLTPPSLSGYDQLHEASNAIERTADNALNGEVTTTGDETRTTHTTNTESNHD